MLEKTINNKDLSITLFKKLFSDLPLQLDTIEAALQKNEVSTCLDAVHKLHGSASFCGLSDIQALAYNIEYFLAYHKPKLAFALVPDLRKEIERLLAAAPEIFRYLQEQ